MNEVSCRAFSYFQEAERAGWITVEDLLVGSRLELDTVLDPSRRVDWEDWSRLCDRFADLVGIHRMRESGRFAISREFVGPALHRIAPLFISPTIVHKATVTRVIPDAFRCCDASITEEPDHRLRIGVRLRPGHRPSLAWFEMTVGGLALAPTYIGLPPAVFEATVSEAHLEMRIEAPLGAGRRRWLRRLKAALLAPAGIADELAEQQQKLANAYDELARRERGVYDLLAGMPACVALLRDERIAYANPALARTVGRPPSELVGALPSSLVVPEDREALDRLLAGARTGDAQRVRFAATPTPRTLLVSPIEAPTSRGGTAHGLFGIDVTEEEEAKETLRHHEETLAAVSSATPDIIARLTLDGTVLDMFGGRSRPSLVASPYAGRGLKQLGPLDDAQAAEVVAAITEAVRTGAHARRELTLQLRDGEVIFECIFTPLPARKQVLVLVRDITERRAHERELAVAERMASLGTLVAGLGHELNNPLSYVLANQRVVIDGLEAIAEGKPANVGALRTLSEEVLQGATRMGDLVRGLAAFSRVDKAAVKAVMIEEAIDDALRMTATQLRHVAEVRKDFGRVGAVEADRSRVVQILVNLLVNAAQASASDEGRALVITVRTRREGNEVAATVTDTGRGMAATTLARIFDPFFTTKPAGQGTGLGLAIVHRVIRELGGDVTAESAPGVGTTIKLSFRPASAPLIAPRAKTRPPESDLRVLVVDDEPPVARAMARILHGMTAVVCDSGDEAIRLVTEGGRFDAVLCDLNMPGTDGIAVFEALRKHDPALAGKFVFMTGGVFTERGRKFLRQGSGIVSIEKPPDRDELRRLIQAAARQKRPPARAGGRRSPHDFFEADCTAIFFG